MTDRNVAVAPATTGETAGAARSSNVLEAVGARANPTSVGDVSMIRLEIVALIGVLSLAALLRWELLAVRSIWFDEAYSLLVARLGVPGILEFLRTNDAHPAGYYVMLSWWMGVFGDGIVPARILSFVAGMATVALTWWLGRTLFSRWVGVTAALLVAVNPFQVMASNEIRMYMPLAVASLLSTWILWKASRPGSRWWTWAAYGLTVAVMGYLSYFAALVVTGHLVWLLLTGARDHVRGLALALSLALVLYAPWLPYLDGILERNPQLLLRAPVWPGYPAQLLATQSFGGYLFGTVTYHMSGELGLKDYGPLVAPFVILALAGAAALGWASRQGRNLVALSWLVPMLLVLAVSLVLGRQIAYDRNLVFLQPFLAVLLAGGIVHIRETVLRAPKAVAAGAALAVVLAFAVPAVENLQGNPAYQFYRWDAAARHVARHYRAGDVVAYLPGGIDIVFEQYFQPSGRRVQIAVNFDLWSREEHLPLMRKAAEHLAEHRGRVWLIVSFPTPPGSVEDLKRLLTEQGFRSAGTEDFRGVSVTAFARPGGDR